MQERLTTDILADTIAQGVPLHSHAVIALALSADPVGEKMYSQMMRYYRGNGNHIERIRFLRQSFARHFDTESSPIELSPNGNVIDGNHRFTWAMIKGVEKVWVYEGDRPSSRFPMNGEELMDAWWFEKEWREIVVDGVEKFTTFERGQTNHPLTGRR